MEWTHKRLVEAAGAWLRKSYPIVFEETVCWSSQVPDAIGFSSSKSVLIECKASRSDFLADKRKRHIAEPHQSMGALRYYACVPGIVGPNDIPDAWGWLEPSGNRLVELKRPKYQEANLKAEKLLLISALRRGLPVCAVNRRAAEWRENIRPKMEMK